MKRRRLLLTALLLVLVLGARRLPAQEGGCGTVLTPEGARIHQENLANGYYDLSQARTEGDYAVKLAFHIVRRSDQTGGISQDQLDQAMLDNEEAFAGTGLCFYVGSTDYIDDSGYYDIGSQAEADELRGVNVVPDAVNMYFVNSLVTTASLCGQSSFTFSAHQGIIYRNSCIGVSTDHATFPHELGHYFDLFHTHETAFGEECPDGSNCDSAGDLLCDTPADPGLSNFTVNPDCEYVGNESVYCNGYWQYYYPDPVNMMSYTRRLCASTFTQDQKDKILATYLNLRPELYREVADLTHVTPSGWTSSLVPRNDAAATVDYCPVTPVLDGNAAATHLNLAIRNEGDGSAPAYINRIYLDNTYCYWVSWSGQWPHSWNKYINSAALTVRGGRHALHDSLDWADEVCESDETNNSLFTQWVWSPYQLAADEFTPRNSPPDKMTAHFTYPNCDGFQFNTDSWWEVVGVMPGTTTADYDIYLHNDYTGSTGGFETPLAFSWYGGGAADWVIVNRNVAPSGNYQAGVVNFNGESGGCRVERASSSLYSLTDGSVISDEMEAGEFLDIFEIYVGTSDLPYYWTFTVETEGAEDPQCYLYDKSLEFASRVDFLAAFQESFSLHFTEAGYYLLAVHKAGADHINDTYDYTVTMTASYPEVVIDQGSPPAVVLFLDRDPWGSPAWETELEERGIDYTLLPSAAMDTADFRNYNLIITVASANGYDYHEHLMNNMDRFQEFMEKGGILLMSACTQGETGVYLDGIENNYAPTNYADITDPAHPLMAGVNNPAYGSSAVHNCFLSVPGNWDVLATSSETGEPCFLVNETMNAVLQGCPVEHTWGAHPGNLGETVGNMLDWAYYRATNTLVVDTYSWVPNEYRPVTYLNTGYPSLTFHNQELLDWLNVSPLAGVIPAYGGFPVDIWFIPTDMAVGTYRGTMSIVHEHPTSPSTVWVVMNVLPRTPRAPQNLTLEVLDVTGGQRLCRVSYDPVTEGTDGMPLDVDYYYWYVNTEPYGDYTLLGWVYGYTTTLDVDFTTFGFSDLVFLQVTAVDNDGLMSAVPPGIKLPPASPTPEKRLR